MRRTSNVQHIVTKYECSRCRKEHNLEDAAFDCCYSIFTNPNPGYYEVNWCNDCDRNLDNCICDD